jgi:hypothetical protein
VLQRPHDGPLALDDAVAADGKARIDAENRHTGRVRADPDGRRLTPGVRSTDPTRV